MGVLYTKCDCGAVYENRRYADGIFCIRCWAKTAALEAMCASPHLWDTYDDLTRSEYDGEDLDGFQLEVLDVVRARMPRRDERHFRFQNGGSK